VAEREFALRFADVRSTFPETRVTIVAALASSATQDRSRALDLIARAYREPLIALLRHRWSLDRPDAEDLAQEFFARAVEKGWFYRYDATRGKFRTFLRTCVEDFARTHAEYFVRH
jgi:DNA-directed RNA polymerase specialized sigma24 family protein